jgi:hypothetical protein
VQQDTVKPKRVSQQPTPPPPTPIFSLSLAPRRSQRVIPTQVPSPRVTPRLSSSDVAPPKVPTALSPTAVIPITPHQSSVNALYMPQFMAGVNLFDTFEEEHMDTPAVPW